MEWFVRVLNRCISFVAFLAATTLVVYMLIVIVTGTFDVANVMFDTLLLESDERQSIFNALNSEFLHNIAVLLILMKAYRILVEYMRYHHIDLKYMIEIAVIACVLELLFNATAYSEQMQWILAALSTAFLAVYAFRYDTLLKAVNDTQASLFTTPSQAQKTFENDEPHELQPVEKSKAKPRKRATRKVAKKKA